MTLLVLATTNPGKAAEFRALFAAHLEFSSLTLATPPELGSSLPEIEETGATFAENAALKAVTLARATGQFALADDSGLCVDALGGAPGVHSARWGGPNLGDSDRTALLLSRMESVPDASRGARFVCVLALAGPDGALRGDAEGVCSGVLTRVPRGDAGFGYDPIFEIPALGRTLAELSPARKNFLSHRASAFRALLPVLFQVFFSRQD